MTSPEICLIVSCLLIGGVVGFLLGCRTRQIYTARMKTLLVDYQISLTQVQTERDTLLAHIEFLEKSKRSTGDTAPDSSTPSPSKSKTRTMWDTL